MILVLAAQGFVVDHASLPLFEKIPDQYLEAARNLRILFMDRSVGVNTHLALDCLTAADYGSSRVPCRADYQPVGGSWKRIVHRSRTAAPGVVPDYIRFNPGPVRYNRMNWKFYLFHGHWEKMTEDFISGLRKRAIPAQDFPGNRPVRLNPLDFDVLSFQFTYFNVEDGNTIADFFTRRPGEYNDVHDLEREIAALQPGAGAPPLFVYWTTSLARSIGTETAAGFNGKTREWCRANGKVLFDFADILSHDMHGKPCYDNRDGVPYSTPSGSASENYPDDGRKLPAICQEKTTEVDGGHLATAQGLIGVAKGFWVLAARLAGWNPEALK
jgi:hypothetical protein